MSILAHEIRHGAYADSIVLMQLQSALVELEGVSDAGVVMATAVNLELLRASELLPDPPPKAAADDLVIVVRAVDREAASAALAEVDALMARRSAATASDFRPRSLDSAWKMLPEARWALVSVPGRYAARVAEEVLAAGRSVFLYSDNVAQTDEVRLKAVARDRGLLLMGPDCGTAMVAGCGLGFANRVRRGPVGIVAAAGTGLQAVASRVHRLGSGISQALGTGGRDLSAEVGGTTALQAVELLSRDEETKVITLVSKPPAPEVAARLLARARQCGKPVVVAFSGVVPPVERIGNLHFARSLDEAAELAVGLVSSSVGVEPVAAEDGFLRGLFSGGTLALEVLHALALLLQPLASNLEAEGVRALENSSRSHGHTVLDLGADELTVGRAHPMIDPELRLRRLRQEAEDPEVALILLDVVLGDGAHPAPAAELAPVIREVLARDRLEVVVLVVGTEADPQNLETQAEALEAVGAQVVHGVRDAIERVAARLAPAPEPEPAPVALELVREPLAAVNVGLEMFADSLVAQEANVVHVDWRPPAGGNERLAAILDKMR